MNCYHCDQPMTSGTGEFRTWGDRKVLAHKRCDRDALVARARALGVFDNADQHDDQRLIDAIAAELLSAEWLARLDKLSTDEAKRDAVHQLRVSMWG